jgi:hypothetical protein
MFPAIRQALFAIGMPPLPVASKIERKKHLCVTDISKAFYYQQAIRMFNI